MTDLQLLIAKLQKFFKTPKYRLLIFTRFRGACTLFEGCDCVFIVKISGWRDVNFYVSYLNISHQLLNKLAIKATKFSNAIGANVLPRRCLFQILLITRCGRLLLTPEYSKTIKKSRYHIIQLFTCTYNVETLLCWLTFYYFNEVWNTSLNFWSFIQ